MKKVARRTGTHEIKRCACGKSYTTAEWKKLRYVGEQVDEAERGELRDCSCGSTLSLATPRVRIAYFVEASTDGGWLLFRRVGDTEPKAFGVGNIATVFATKEAAQKTVPWQQRSDKRAATRLAVEIVDTSPANDNGKEG